MDDTRRLEQLADEVEALIDRFGIEALARDFLRGRASSDLSIVIRAVMAERDDPASPATLGIVQERINGGVLNELTGQGALDHARHPQLLREIAELVDRHGGEAPAERFLS